MIWSSGDSAWAEAGEAYRPDLTNLGNTMGRMEYGKMMAGCAAALTTETGQLGYLGPLINAETRRLASSVYLGARYCWENFRGEDPADLSFRVDWIGFWFNIPGFTLDPTQVANDFFDSGIDVVISGIDTTEGLVVAGQRAAAGESVWAIPYDYRGACDEAPDICLGVPYFNWGPAYLRIVESVIDGTFEAGFEWFGPDWDDLNNIDTSGVGFLNGPGLSADERGDARRVHRRAGRRLDQPVHRPAELPGRHAVPGRRRSGHRPADLVHGATARRHGGGQLAQLGRSSRQLRKGGRRPPSPLSHGAGGPAALACPAR